MTDYTANVSADFSGYTTSVQQAIAQTKQFAAANEGLTGAVGKAGTKAIVKFTEVLGLQGKMMKANVAEAANYQQALGKVSANAVAAGKSVSEVQKASKDIARNLTGNIGSGQAAVGSAQALMGTASIKSIKEMSKALTELGAATGESGAEIGTSLAQISRSYGMMPDPKRVQDLGDSLVATSAKFGTSATAVSGFAKQIAPFAKQIGLAQTSVIGLSTSFAKIGEEGYRGANIANKVFADIDAAVREGAPTLGTYAATLGKTYDETLKLAKSSPKEFFVQFLEALDKQGTGAIRTLEALGFEGVRTQKVLKDLASGGMLREQIATAEEAYGSGITGTSAEEVMSGLNESSAKLQESLKQVVANGGEPFLDWMEKVTSMGQGMADVLAKVTDSGLFKFLTSGAVIGAGMAGLAVKGASMAVNLGTVGAVVGAVNQGTGGRLEAGRQALMANRGKFALGGMAGMMAGSMTDNPTLSNLGMAAMAASAFAGPKTFSVMKTVMEATFRDSLEALNVPAGKWTQTKMGREARLAREMIPGLGYIPTGSQDQFATALKAMRNEGFDKASIAKMKEVTRALDARGKPLAESAALLARMNDAIRDTGRVPADVMRQIDLVERNMPAQTGGMKLRNYGRTAAGMVGQIGTGIGSQVLGLGGLIGGIGVPALAIGGVAAAVGAGLWANKRVDEKYALRETNTIAQGEQVAEKYGMVAPVFEGIALAGSKLTGTFEDLSISIGKMLGPDNKGEVSLTASEYANIKAPEKPSTDLQFQNRRFLWQTTGSQMTGTQAMSELIAAYGAKPTQQGEAAMVMDLKAQGKTVEEVNRALAAYRDATDGATGALENTVKDWVEGRNKGFWEKETWVDAAKRWSADSGMSDQQQMIAILDEMQKQAPGLTTQDLQKMWKDFADVFGFEGIKAPEFQGGRSVTGGVSSESVAGASGTGQYGRGQYQPRDGTDAGTGGEPAPKETPTEASNRAAAAATLSAAFGRTFGDLENKVRGLFPAAPMGQFGTDIYRVAREDSSGIDRNARPGSPEWVAQQGVDRSKDAAIKTTVEILDEAVGKFQEGDTAGNAQRSAKVAAAMEATAGSAQKALENVQAMKLRVTPDSAAGQTLAGAEQYLTQFRGREYSGMSDFRRILEQGKDAKAALKVADDMLKAGEKSEAVQKQWVEANQAVNANREQEVSYMQNYLKAYRAMETQLRYSQEDYSRSRQYAQEDYGTQRAQAAEQFATQQRYAQEAYARQMKYMQEDYQTASARSERDYYKQRQYQTDDFAKGMKRRMEDLAKGMMDPFQRIAVESTWSGAGIVNNLAEQEAQMREQIANLNKLRESGVDQGAIDLLGLNDPKKAQQLDRLLGDIQAGGTDIVARLNEAAAARGELASQLFSGENSIDTRRQEEDFAKGMQRMSEARQTFLADSAADYDKARKRAQESFDVSMRQARESYDTSMRYMAQAHQKAMNRMAEQHDLTMRRTREQFNEQFNAITSDYETLIAATTQALQDGTVDWTGVIDSGTATMKQHFADNAADLGSVWVDSFAKELENEFGKNSVVMQSMEAVLMALGAAVGQAASGGGPGAGQAPVPEYDGTAGPTWVVGGKGVYNTNNPYGKPGNYAAGYHTGADVGAPLGTPIYSTVSGIVTKAGWEGAYGNRVRVDNGYGITMLYAHMSSITTSEGARVGRGTQIGRVGSTGNSRGTHVHVEARKAGRPRYPEYGSDVDPRPYMYDGGITTRRVQATIGEGGYPEAVIPLNHRGIDVLGQALQKAFSTTRVGSVHGNAQQQATVTYIVTEDHSVNVNGAVEVVSQDPQKVLREIERIARRQAIVAPSRSSL